MSTTTSTPAATTERRDDAPESTRGIVTFLLICVIAAALGVLLTPPPAGASVTPARHISSTVRDYNDGFTDAKIDDCEQGFRPCAWLNHGRALPEWFRAYRTSRRADGHPCLLVGAEFHPHRTGIVCANGTAHVLGNVHRGARVVLMPRFFHWAGSERNSAIQVWAGTGDTSLAVGDDAYMSTS